MGIRRGFAAWKPVKLRRRTKIWILLAVCLLLCGFVWTWTIEFVMPVIFPVEEAVDFEMIQDFPALINVDGLQGYLTETQMAEEITQGIRTNLVRQVYSDIELADMRMEHPGKRIIRIILDRIFG